MELSWKMCKRTDMVFIYIGVLCLSQGVISDWTGATKRLLDVAPITSEDVKNITTEIFSGVNYTAMYQACETKPVALNVLSPVGCDLVAYAYMGQGLDHPDQFNGNSFLCGIWYSMFGEALVEYFQRKGVNVSLLNDAFRQTWFKGDKAILLGSSFEKVFFGRSNSSKSFNNWYTFFMIRSRYGDAQMVYEGSVLPQCIRASLSGSYSAEFVYPSHPLIDLIVYTLCYWRSDDNNRCKAQVPGNKTLAVKVHKQRDSEDNFYLYNANIDCLNSR